MTCRASVKNIKANGTSKYGYYLTVILNLILVVKTSFLKFLNLPTCAVTVVTRTTTTWMIVDQSTSSNSRKRLSLKPNLGPERIIWPYFSKNYCTQKVGAIETCKDRKQQEENQGKLNLYSFSVVKLI
jgi:hypothetical protein